MNPYSTTQTSKPTRQLSDNRTQQQKEKPKNTKVTFELPKESPEFKIKRKQQEIQQQRIRTQQKDGNQPDPVNFSSLNPAQSKYDAYIGRMRPHPAISYHPAFPLL